MSPYVLLVCNSFLDLCLCCFWWLSYFWGGLVVYFVEFLSVWDFFSLLDWSSEFGRERPQKWSAIFIPSHQGFILSIWLTPAVLTWITWLRECMPGFANVKLLFASSFHSLHFGIQSPNRLQCWEAKLQVIEGRSYLSYLAFFCMGDFCLLPCNF